MNSELPIPPEGMRLLESYEKGAHFTIPISGMLFWNINQWDSGGVHRTWIGNSAEGHYATALSPAELRAARDIPEQPVSDTPTKDFDWCEQCGFPMMLCGHPNLSEEPSLDCKVCILLENLAAAQRERDEANQANESKSSLLLNISDTLRVRGFTGTHLDERVIEMAQALDEAQCENAELRERLRVRGKALEIYEAAIELLRPTFQDHAAIAKHNEGHLGMPSGPCMCIQCRAFSLCGTPDHDRLLARAEAAEATVKRMIDALKESDSMLEFYYGRFGEELATHERQRLDALRDKNMEALNP